MPFQNFHKSISFEKQKHFTNNVLKVYLLPDLKDFLCLSFLPFISNLALVLNEFPMCNSKAITCLASSADGSLLVSGSEDGMIRVWDTERRNITRVFRHAKGTINYS